MPLPQTINTDNDLSGIMSAIHSLDPVSAPFYNEPYIEPVNVVKRSSAKNVLKKCYGIWTDRTDVSDSVEYVNDLRASWNICGTN